MGNSERNRIVFQFAQKYLEENLPAGLSKADLEKYYEPKPVNQLNNMGEVYEQFIMSAQNRYSMPNNIKFNNEHPNDKKQIKDILFSLYGDNSYDLAKISALDSDFLYENFSTELGISGKLWQDWCKSVVDAAEYLQQFSDVNDFKSFVAKYDGSNRERIVLIDKINKQHHIYGMGFALICDALKEMGFCNFSKPDVHIKNIFTSLGLSDANEKHIFIALGELAADNGVTPYKADKIFWLICSGYFYKDFDDNVKYPKADDFIEKAKRVM
jgi:hypothetical protein